MNCEEKTKKQNLIYNGRILALYNDEVTLADGSESKREYVHHNGGSSVLAVDKEGYVYLVEQFRYPYREMLLEIPAGKTELGESAYDCAIRELKEEVGLTADSLIDLGVIYPSPGYTDEPLHIFLATSFTVGENNPDEHELINTKKIKFAEALQMVERNEIKDAKTVTAILRYAVEYRSKKL
ncbi:MAG: NUDIX hydrolase [Clostridia bacterium]|nr:NUDIX hydrolase [Clostridia bacterium]MDE6471844.1 NUDIX hydrolase [Clostridia bacterium]